MKLWNWNVGLFRIIWGIFKAYFADSRRDGDTGSNSFENTFGNTMPGATVPGGTDFEVSSSDDLPF